MGFISDKQTMEDLALLGKFKPNSIYSLFNRVITAGGEKLLEQMFRDPLQDHSQINKRSDTFAYFQRQGLDFPIQPEVFGLAEEYLGSYAPANAMAATVNVLRAKAASVLLRSEQYQQLHKGLIASMEVLNALNDLVKKIDLDLVAPAKNILSDKRLAWLLAERGKTELPVMALAKYDGLLRSTLRKEMEVLLDIIYQLDVFIAVSAAARDHDFCYATALPGSANIFDATGLRHPGIAGAISNPVSISAGSNVIFLTGANMAGKSTLMKSFGIAVYLAHMGFPVAAKTLSFSIRHGLYTSINVPDNLSMGQSHFYAEVLRVKMVAKEVSSGKNMIVIFDELFKGTNVKDAYDATFACTAAFAKYYNCGYLISTHIIELGEALKDLDNVQFQFLPTIMEGNTPRYTYKLSPGITSDRQGMIIIENEKILDDLYL